jgi:hypothetical protein
MIEGDRDLRRTFFFILRDVTEGDSVVSTTFTKFTNQLSLTGKSYTPPPHPKSPSDTPFLGGVGVTTFEPHVSAPLTAKRTRDAFLK